MPEQDDATSQTAKPTLWARLAAWDSKLSVAKGLTAVTLLTGFFGGYFQYLNAYEDKVSALAKADMDTATATFLAISNAFAEAQTLQQLIFYNYAAIADGGADAGGLGMVTKAGNDGFDPYMKARTQLRRDAAVFAHKAEIYIDWASDTGRDPAAARLLDQDPLTEALLGLYDFDCDAEANMPSFAPPPAPGGQDPCTAPTGPTPAPSQQLQLCARDRKAGGIDRNRPSITIDWQSAKHHVLTLHFCFEQSHRQIATARVWASQNPVSDERAKAFKDNEDRYAARLDRQVVRLNAFMSLAMAHLESIRVKYRPTGFLCHVPLLRDAIGSRCMPIRTAGG